MKYFKLLSLAFSTLLSANTFGNPQFEYNGLRYELNTDRQEVFLMGFPSGRSDTIVIASQVPYNGLLYPVTTMIGQSFYQCWWLSKVIIPSSIREILLRPYTNPFDACLNLQTIVVENSNKWLCTEDNVLYDKDKTALYCYPGGKTQEKFFVPEGVNYISAYAFSSNPHIEAVHLPQTAKSIGPGAFNMCYNLKSINIPSSVEKLEDNLFYECTSLEMVDIPESVTSLGMAVFAECNNLKFLIIRGFVGRQYLNMGLDGIPESATIYVQSNEIEKYKEYFLGNVLSIELYNPTAIHNIAAPQIVNRESSNGKWYDLSGRRVSHLPKGVYIKDGRKVVVK